MNFFLILSNTLEIFITLYIFVQIKKIAIKQENSGDKGLPKTSNTDSDSEFLPDS